MRFALVILVTLAIVATPGLIVDTLKPHLPWVKQNEGWLRGIAWTATLTCATVWSLL